MPLSNGNVYALALLAVALLFLLQSLRGSLPSLPSPSSPTPLLVPWPLLLIGTQTMHYLHTVMMRLAPPQLTLYWLSGSFAITGALRTAAKLGIADALEGGGGRSVWDVANATGCHAPHLQRLLVALESIGAFVQRSDGLWYNTHMSEFLRGSHPASMRAAVMMLGEEQLVAFSRLDHALTSSHAAFPLVYGQPLYSYLARHPSSYRTFSRGQHGLSFLVDAQLVTDYAGFESAEVVCDVAGGLGALLRQILTAHPHISGVLFDTPEVIAEAADMWRHSALQNRSRLQAGDFFAPSTLPTACDTYLLKQVLHQYSDAQAALILSNVVQAAAHPAPRLLVIERIMSRPSSFIASHGAAFVDLVMMAVFEGGRERDAQDWSRVFQRAGLDWRSTVETRSDFAVMECWPVTPKTEDGTAAAGAAAAAETEREKATQRKDEM